MNFLFHSINILSKIGGTGLIILSLIMLLCFGLVLYLINKKKKKTQKSLAAFSQNIKEMLAKFDTAEQQIETLNLVIERIKADKKYDKTPDWKNSVLARVYEHMAKIYFDTNNDKGIIDMCSKIIEHDPSNGMAYYNRGSIYSNNRNYDKALEDFNDALIILPVYADIYNNRGLVYSRKSEYNKALSDFNKAINIKPTPITYYNRANLFYGENMLNEALKDYTSFLEMDTNNSYNMHEDINEIIKEIKERLNN